MSPPGRTIATKHAPLPAFLQRIQAHNARYNRWLLLGQLVRLLRRYMAHKHADLPCAGLSGLLAAQDARIAGIEMGLRNATQQRDAWQQVVGEHVAALEAAERTRRLLEGSYD